MTSEGRKESWKVGKMKAKRVAQLQAAVILLAGKKERVLREASKNLGSEWSCAVPSAEKYHKGLKAPERGDCKMLIFTFFNDSNTRDKLNAMIQDNTGSVCIDSTSTSEWLRTQ